MYKDNSAKCMVQHYQCYNIMEKLTIYFNNETAARLDEITSDFHLGFGAFNEKPLLPFTSRVRLMISETRTIESTDYSYRHVVSLTSNVTKFRVC